MTDDPIPAPMPSALRTREDFHAALRWALAHALAQRVRRLYWLDPDFAAWPLDEAWVLEPLTAWLRLPQRRLVLVARTYEQVARQHPRFVRWRRDWAHAIEAWSPAEGAELPLPTLLIDSGPLCLQLHDSQQWRGRLALDEAAARQWRDEIDALLQRCESAFAAYTIGL